MGAKKIGPDSIGLRVRAARLKAGLTQEQLARAADVGTLHVSKIERSAVKDPGALTIGKIAAALSVTTDSLIFGRAQHRS